MVFYSNCSPELKLYSVFGSEGRFVNAEGAVWCTYKPKMVYCPLKNTFFFGRESTWRTQITAYPAQTPLAN